ncbi:Prosaposin, partial [Mucuna pruriens]
MSRALSWCFALTDTPLTFVFEVIATGTMVGRVGLLFLILLGASWACDARELATFELNRKSDVCALCEKYATEALDYLNDIETQREVIDALHNTCYHVPSLKDQCIELVDSYASHFFSEIASVVPGELCKQFHLCKSANVSSQVQGNTCDSCKDTVLVLLAKLSDPDTKLEIMEALLKGCNSMDKLAKKCKRMVIEYGPLILIKAEKFLKTTDICTALHACPASTAFSKDTSVMEEVPLISDS